MFCWVQNRLLFIGQGPGFRRCRGVSWERFPPPWAVFRRNNIFPLMQVVYKMRDLFLRRVFFLVRIKQESSVFSSSLLLLWRVQCKFLLRFVPSGACTGKKVGVLVLSFFRFQAVLCSKNGTHLSTLYYIWDWVSAVSWFVWSNDQEYNSSYSFFRTCCARLF